MAMFLMATAAATTWRPKPFVENVRGGLLCVCHCWSCCVRTEDQRRAPASPALPPWLERVFDAGSGGGHKGRGREEGGPGKGRRREGGRREDRVRADGGREGGGRGGRDRRERGMVEEVTRWQGDYEGAAWFLMSDPSLFSCASSVWQQRRAQSVEGGANILGFPVLPRRSPPSHRQLLGRTGDVSSGTV
eukprot:765387-Hanusia_phi.AAC.4